LIDKLPHSRRYCLSREGYQVCLVYLKLAHKVYAPLTAAVLERFPDDGKLNPQKLTRLDRAYTAVLQSLDALTDELGLKAA